MGERTDVCLIDYVYDGSASRDCAWCRRKTWGYGSSGARGILGYEVVWKMVVFFQSDCGLDCRIRRIVICLVRVLSYG